MPRRRRANQERHQQPAVALMPRGGDAKGEWTAVCSALGGHPIEPGVGLAARLNPLDEGPRPSGVSEQEWRIQVGRRRQDLLYALTVPTLGRALRAPERTALDAGL